MSKRHRKAQHKRKHPSQTQGRFGDAIMFDQETTEERCNEKVEIRKTTEEKKEKQEWPR